MKRIAAFTLILALLLAGCGTRGAEGPVSPPGAETPPAPDGEAAAAFEAEALILARLYANGESGELFRLDFNGDGAEDLVLRKDGMRTSWMFIPGGSAPEPDIVFDLSAAGGMEVYYSESEGRLVIEKYYGSVGHSLEMYSLYDGVSFTEAASSEQGQDAPRPACVVDGVDATEAMYEARVEGLALARLENGADINGPLSAGLPEGGYEAAAEYLSGLPFVERTELLESGESVFYCNSGDNAPSGLALSYYEAMGSASSWYPDLGEWGDYAVTLRADGSLDFAPYEGSRAPEPTPEPSPEPTEPEPTPSAQAGDAMLEGIESDGEYLLTLYPDGLERVEGGCYVRAELTDFARYSDAEVEARLAEYGGEYSYEMTGEAEWIYYHDGSFCRPFGEEAWRSYGPSDAAELEVVSAGRVFVPDSAAIYDNCSPLAFGVFREVTRIEELFSVSFQGGDVDYPSAEVKVTVSGGQISAVDMYYTP